MTSVYYTITTAAEEFLLPQCKQVGTETVSSSLLSESNCSHDGNSALRRAETWKSMGRKAGSALECQQGIILSSVRSKSHLCCSLTRFGSHSASWRLPVIQLDSVSFSHEYNGWKSDCSMPQRSREKYAYVSASNWIWWSKERSHPSLICSSPFFS